jgi:hypothetical protein
MPSNHRCHQVRLSGLLLRFGLMLIIVCRFLFAVLLASDAG